MRSRADLARGAAATVALAALLVGVPVLLVAAVGWPLPRTLPRVADIGDTLAGDRPLEAATAWKVLAIPLWIAWAQVVVCVLIEARAAARGVLPRHLPGFGLGHGLAAPLVATVVLALPGGHAARHTPPAAPIELANAATGTEEPAAPTPAPAPPTSTPGTPADVAPTASPPPVIEHVVQRRDTLWDLAERYLGDGYRARELFELNAGRPQPDGATLIDPGLIRPGWVLHIPAPPTAVPEPTTAVTVAPGDTLWDLAEDHLGDGHRYREIVALNAGRPQPDGHGLSDPNRIEPGWLLLLPQPPSPPASPQAPPVPAAEVTTDEPATPAPPSSATTVPVPTTTTNAAPAQPADSTDDEEDGTRLVAPVGLVGGGVATAGLLLALDRRRRAQLRNRRRGEVPAPMSADDAQAERELRAGAEIDVARNIDVAARGAAAGTGTAGLPPLRWAEADDNGLTLHLDRPAPPPPGFEATAPNRWQQVVPGHRMAGADASASPAPCLVPAGTDADGTVVLIDLECPPVTLLRGEPDAARDFLHSIAATLSTAPWSWHARVACVGSLDPHLPEVEHAGSLDDALDELERRADTVAAALAALRCQTLGQARSAGATPDMWSPVVVLSDHAPTDRQRQRLQALAQLPARAIGIVVVDPDGPDAIGRVITIDETGVLTVTGLDRPLTAQRLAVDDLERVEALLANASEPTVPAEASDTAPAAGEPEPDPTVSLQDLLAEVDVMIRVFGDVEAVRPTATGDEPVVIGKQKAVEAVTYMALRDGPVDRDGLQAALWPAGANSIKTLHNTVWAARKGLGRDRDGLDLFPVPDGGHYLLSPRVVTDYGLFHDLVSAAEDSDDPQLAGRLLTEALSVVHGEPFLGLGRGFAWVAPHAGIIVAQVVDAAEELAEMRLAAGDWRGAEWAARQGLRVFPCEERLYRLLMRAAHAAGSVPGVQRAYQELSAALADPDDGVEPDDTVHPETVALLEQLTGHRNAQRSA